MIIDQGLYNDTVAATPSLTISIVSDDATEMALGALQTGTTESPYQTESFTANHAAGFYVVVDAPTASDTDDLSFAIVADDLTAGSVIDSGYDSPFIGSIAPGSIDEYTFTASAVVQRWNLSAGQEVAFDGGGDVVSSSRIRIYEPNLDIVFDGAGNDNFQWSVKVSGEQQFDFLRRQFLQDGELPFTDVLSGETVTQALDTIKIAWNERIYTPLVTLWVFLGQVLSADHCCRAAVARFVAYRISGGESQCSSQTGAYCQARKRLPEEFFAHVVRQTGAALEEPPCVHVRWFDHLDAGHPAHRS